MVGLYHKRRAQRSQSKAVRYVIRAAIAMGSFVVIGFTLVVLLVNGSQIKGPLASYLSSKLGVEVQIEDAEFSPIYPDVIRLKDVSFGDSKIGELYIEYDLSSLGEDEFVINDIYLNGLTASPEDLKALSVSQMGYKSMRAQQVRFHHTPVKTNFLSADDASLRLEKVTFAQEQGLTFRSGSLSTGEAKLFDQACNNFTIEFAHNEQGFSFDNFSVSIYGGVMSGRGDYETEDDQEPIFAATTEKSTSADTDILEQPAIKPANAHKAKISLEELHLNKVVLPEQLNLPDNISLDSKIAYLSDVILSNENQELLKDRAAKDQKDLAETKDDKQDKSDDKGEQSTSGSKYQLGAYETYVMQGIKGTIRDLAIGPNGTTFSYFGGIEAIAFPNLQTTLEHNEVNATIGADTIDFKLLGKVYEGIYSASGNLNSSSKILTIDDFKLAKAKLALNPPRADFLNKKFDQYTLNLKLATFNNLEFLSYINSLPLSIAKIGGTIENLSVHGSTLKNDADDFYRNLSQFSPIAISKNAEQDEAKDKAASKDDAKSDTQLAANKDASKTNEKEAAKQESQALNSVAELNLELDNVLYSNLLMSDVAAKLTLDDKSLRLDLPKLNFKESYLTASFDLPLVANEEGSLMLQAQDFESADLNSNLIAHMLTGKMDVMLNLKGKLSSNAVAKAKDQDGKTADSPAVAMTLDNLMSSAQGQLKVNADNLLISDFGLDLINGGKKENFTLSGTELLTAIQGSVAGISDLRITGTFNKGVANVKGKLGLSTADMTGNLSYNFKDDSLSGKANLVSLAGDSSTTVVLSGDTNKTVYNIKANRRGEMRPGLYLPQFNTTAKAKEQTDAAAVLNGKVKIEKAKAPKKEEALKEETKVEPKVNTEEAAKAKTEDTPKEALKDQAEPKPSDEGKASDKKADEDTKQAQAASTEEAKEAAPSDNKDDALKAETKEKTEPAAQEAVKTDAAMEDSSKAAEPNKEESTKATDNKAKEEAQPEVKAQDQAQKDESKDSDKAASKDKAKDESLVKDQALAEGNKTVADKAEAKESSNDASAAEGKDVDDAAKSEDEEAQDNSTESPNEQDLEAATTETKDDLMRQKADATEKDLLKDALIDSIFSKEAEEDLIF